MSVKFSCPINNIHMYYTVCTEHATAGAIINCDIRMRAQAIESRLVSLNESTSYRKPAVSHTVAIIINTQSKNRVLYIAL